MKVVINVCFGGFSLSPLAIKELAKLQRKECYFFTQNIKDGLDSEYIPTTPEKAKNSFMFSSFNIPNPNNYFHKKDWREMSLDERSKEHELYEKYMISKRDIDRDNTDLIKVIKKLGKKANGKWAKLKVVGIPDGTDYEITEYDGFEHIAEKHKTWR